MTDLKSLAALGVIQLVLLAPTGLFSLPFMLLGLGLVIAGVRPLIAASRVTRPEVTVSNASPRVGEALTVNYAQTFKRATAVNRIVYQLVLHESATYQRGTDSVNVGYDHVVQQYETTPRQFAAGEMLNDRREFQVPPLGMHTFSSRHNKLNWLMRVQVEMQGWPDFKEDFGLVVVPEMAR